MERMEHKPQMQDPLLPQNHCPLLVLAAGREGAVHTTQCIRYNCAWYDGGARACALVSLAAGVRGCLREK